MKTSDFSVKFKVYMLGLWDTNGEYTAARFCPYYKERNKYNHFLSDFLGDVVLGGLFMRSLYTVIESAFCQNAVPSTILIPKSSIKYIIDNLGNTPFRFKDLSRQIHHQQRCVV